MATLAGSTIASTYALLLKIDSAGVDGTLRKVEDGDATDSALSISTTAIAVDATDRIYLDGGGNTYLRESTGDKVILTVGGTDLFWAQESGGSGSDVVGVLTNTKFQIGNTDTYFIENPDDTLQLYVGADPMMTWAEGGGDRGTISVGVDDAGYDVKFFGETSGDYMLWDQSQNDLILGGSAKLGIGITDPGSAHIYIDETGANARVDMRSTDENTVHIYRTGANNKSNYIYFYLDTADKGMIKFEHNSSDAGNKMHFFTGDNNVENMTMVGDGYTGIRHASPTSPLTVDGLEDDDHQNPVVLINGKQTNGYSMIGDEYVVGENTMSIGVPYSTNGCFIASHITGAGDNVVTHADGWKSTQDNAAARGAAYVCDGANSQHSWFTNETSASIAPGTSRVMTQSMILKQDGDLTIGSTTLTDADSDSHRLGVGIDPSYKLDVKNNKSGSYAARFHNDGDNTDRYGIYVMCGTDDGSTASTTYYFNAGDGDGNMIGNLAHGTDGTFGVNSVSDARLKENIADTKIDGLAICNQLKVREFNWKDYKGGLKNEAGFIAQEVQEVWAPAASGTDGAMKQKLISEAVEAVEAVEEVIDNDPDSKHYGRIVVNAEPAVEGKEAVYEEVIDPMSVAESAFIPVMMKAIQELSDKVTALENA